MKFTLKSLMLLGLLFASEWAIAQSAIIRGKVTDGESGEVLLGATVRLLQGETMKGGAYTDLEGAYAINTVPGDYTLIISYVSFISDTLQVTAAEEAVVFNETLLFQNMQVRKDLEVVITARRDQASTVTLYNQKRNSINAIDGVSVDLIKRTGDPNVAAAMQRITGVTVEGGKYVYVRGLGDRYSKATLNGSEIPSLDPSRNTVQMDIFPSTLIDNIIVYKNFTPDLPGNFSGGLIDVKTKDFPDRFNLNFSTSLGFNTQATFNEDYLTGQTGDTDWLGMDDGTRELPAFITDVASPVAGEGRLIPFQTFSGADTEVINAIDGASKSFSAPIYPGTERAGINQNHQISIGDQFKLGGKPFGYIASLTYRSDFDYYDGGAVGRFKNTSSVNNISERLNTELDLVDQRGGRDVLWGGLIKLSYKPSTDHKFSFNFMHNQSGSASARFMDGEIPSDDEALFYQTRVTGYIERKLDIFQLQGSHAFGEAKRFKMDWIGSYTLSSQDEPDLRFFSNDFLDINGTRLYDIQPNLYPPPNRFFRELSETNYDLKLHFTQAITLGEREGNIKFGGAYTGRDRDFEELRFEFREGPGAEKYNGNPAEYFSPGNLGAFVPEGSNFVRYRVYIQDASEARNAYKGEQTIFAAYAMAELPLNEKLKTIFGARFESTDATTISSDPDLADGELDLNDVLPALHFIYAMKENMNLRMGYSRTLARPTFREFSPFTSFDFVGDFLLSGNSDLERTFIDNFDVRWAWYPTPQEVLSASVFYKNFTDPIEKVIEIRAANLELSYQNVPSAEAYGIELEFRKTLEFLSPALANFQLGGNASFIRSRVDINEEELQLIRSVDPDREEQRPLYGQSPYAFNAELAYVNDEPLGLRVSLSYSVFGERIAVVGGANPDIYEQPRGLLNLSVRKAFGPFAVQVRASNLLNPEYKQIQTYKDVEYIYQNYKVGQSFSVSLSYNIQ